MDYSTFDQIEESKSITAELGVQVGITYKFNKTDWTCPVTAVCPTWKYTDAEGDALVARLANSA